MPNLKREDRLNSWWIALFVVVLVSLMLQGCTALWVGAGAAGGYAAAKDMEDGKLIDN